MMASPKESVATAFASAETLPPRREETARDAAPPTVGLKLAMKTSCEPVKLWLGQKTGKSAEVVLPATRTSVDGPGGEGNTTAIPWPESALVPPR